MKRITRLLPLVLAAVLMPAAATAASVKITPSGIATFNAETAAGDISIQFRKCMANYLYTFYSVKLNGVEVNHTSSDNIGPFLLSNGQWVGGNHTVGADMTGKTVSVDFTVDGQAVATPYSGDCDILGIDVENEIFTADGTTFAIEKVSYRVSGNTVEVTACHDYRYPSPISISRYYGMQSMFIDETEILTPGGACSTWRKLGSGSIEFTKASAPGFCTYVEHSADGYQAAYMVPEDLGLRGWVSGDDVVFIGNSWSKSYHKTIGDHTVRNGDSSRWHGYYSWFDAPITDRCRHASDDLVFEYTAYIDGKPAVMSLDASGSMTRTAGIAGVTAGPARPLATVSGSTVTIDPDAPAARCYDLTGNLIHTGAGSFDCHKGIYIVTDLQGRVMKLMVK